VDRTDGDAPLLTRRTVLVLGAGTVLTVAGTGFALRSKSQTHWAPGGTGSFRFAPEGLKPIRVHYVLGSGDLSSATIVVVMHGDERNAVGYRDAWADLIDDQNIAVVVPEFTSSGFRGSRAYHQGGILDPEGMVLPASQWTFSYIEPLFDEVRDRIGGNQATFDIFGHSAGAQFVHRYVELMPTAPIGRAFAANAGWYTMPDPDVAYPYGAGGIPADLFDWQAVYSTDLTVMLGDRDVDDDNLRHDEGSDAQGLTRWERGHTFFESATSHASSLRLPFTWKLHEVPDVAHDNRQMTAHALHLLF